MYIYIYAYIYIYIYIYIDPYSIPQTLLVMHDVWFIQQGVRPIEGSTHVGLYCCRYNLFEDVFTYLCIIQETKS